jgi:hypothetical protein
MAPPWTCRMRSRSNGSIAFASFVMCDT